MINSIFAKHLRDSCPKHQKLLFYTIWVSMKFAILLALYLPIHYISERTTLSSYFFTYHIHLAWRVNWKLSWWFIKSLEANSFHVALPFHSCTWHVLQGPLKSCFHLVWIKNIKYEIQQYKNLNNLLMCHLMKLFINLIFHSEQSYATLWDLLVCGWRKVWKNTLSTFV